MMRDWDEITGNVIIALAILLAAVLLAVGIIAIRQSIPQLAEGVVVDKTFSPAHTSTHTVMIRSGEVSVPSVRTLHHATSWKIEISGATDEGKVRAEWWEVGEAMYERIKIGDRVRRDPQTGVVSVIGGSYNVK